MANITQTIAAPVQEGSALLKAALPILAIMLAGKGTLTRRQMRKLQRKLIWQSLKIKAKQLFKPKPLVKQRKGVGLLLILLAILTLYLLLTATLWGLILLVVDLIIGFIIMEGAYG
jgi:hypothetical protein